MAYGTKISKYGVFVDDRLIETHYALNPSRAKGLIQYNSWLHGVKYKIKRVDEL